MRNIRSREARRELAARPELLCWVSVSHADQNDARELEQSLPAEDATINGSRGEPSGELHRARIDECRTLFLAERLSPSSNELPLDICCALLRALRLRESDRFMDLGSARGRLVFAAAATAGCALCGGAELSPSGHAAACEARTRLFSTSHSAEATTAALTPAELYCCDLRNAPLHKYNVFYCAIRGDASRPRVVAELVQRMLEAPLPQGAQPPRRLVLAGFGIDVKGTPYEARVKLVRVYAMRANEAKRGDDAQQQTSTQAEEHRQDAPQQARRVEPLAMYGDSHGPRFLLEYAVGP